MEHTCWQVSGKENENVIPASSSVIPTRSESFLLVRNRKERFWTSQNDKQTRTSMTKGGLSGENYSRKLFTCKRGFTLIETIMVMVIAVILAAVVAVRWSPFDTIKLNSATRKVAADIRYAQKVAISTQTRAAITFNANGYDVYQDITVPTRAPSPGDTCSTGSSNNFIVAFNDSRCETYSGVTITSPAINPIAFSSLGTPVDGRTAEPTFGNPIGNQIVTVIYKGASKSINIEEGTGRVSY